MADEKRRDGERREEGPSGEKRTPVPGAAGTFSSDSGSFGASRGDAHLDRDLEEVEREDDDLLAGGRHDVERERPPGR